MSGCCNLKTTRARNIRRKVVISSLTKFAFTACTLACRIAFLAIIIAIAIGVYRECTAYVARQAALKGPSIDPTTSHVYGVASNIGRRPYMEDRHLAVGQLKSDPRASLYAVFDGHGGARAAEFCVRNLVHALTTDLSYPGQPGKALASAFVRVDSEFVQLANLSRPPIDDGTTAIAVLSIGRTLHIANAGDSRAVLVQRNGAALALSSDHKPNRPDETAVS